MKTKVVVDEAEMHCYIGATHLAITTSALMTLNWIALVVLMTAGCVCVVNRCHTGTLVVLMTGGCVCVVSRCHTGTPLLRDCFVTSVTCSTFTRLKTVHNKRCRLTVHRRHITEGHVTPSDLTATPVKVSCASLSDSYFMSGF